MERNQISSLTATSRSIFCLLHSIHRFIAYCAVRFRLQEHFHCRKFFNHMEPSRKRDRREYQMGRYDAKKQKCMDKNREKLERYYMGKEDINALTLPSADRAFPSPLYFPPSDMEDAMEENAVEPVEPRYAEGDILLIEANTKERGYVHLRFLFYISSFCIHSQMYATLLVRFS